MRQYVLRLLSEHAKMVRGGALKGRRTAKGTRAAASTRNKPFFTLSSSIGPDSITSLPSPIQSVSDKKKYKVIRLSNGLTALLISDVTTSDENEDMDIESVSEESSTCVEDSDEYSDMSDSECSSDEDEKMAACGICVGVGSFSDPPKIQGLAHFVEHMLFMGSKKYPKENDFDAFVKKNGGSDNAATDCEQTTFYFEIQDTHLAETMDKFSNFFVAPLMKPDAMQREREAIESEFSLALPSDSNRIDQLLVSFMPKGHPLCTFTWGNSKSLSEPMGPSDSVLYEAAHKFRERHYSAHRMTVAVQARLPLEKLENYVTNTFGHIPSNFMPSDDFSNYSFDPSVVTPEFHSFYHVKPVNQVSELILTWCMKSFLNEYKSKPHQYVSWILGHEGAGSLLSYLRKKVWALGIYTGNSESGVEHTSLACFFSIKLILTPEGLSHKDEVLDAVFSYMNLLKKECPDERIFKEVQSIEDINFRFMDELQACDNVEDLCECMQFYPPEHYITGQDLYYEYKPELIQYVIDSMTPETVNIIMLSHELNDKIDYDCVEPWFETRYKKSDISKANEVRWRNIEPYPDFHLPCPNIYITNNFDLIPMPENRDSCETPELLKNDALIEAWFKPDYKFRLPSAYINISFETPLIASSAKDCCLLSMWCSFLQQILNEKFYDADMAGYSQDLVLGEKGLILKISGFSEKITILAEEIVKIMRNYESYLNEDLFIALKDVQSRNYHNCTIKPSKLARDLRLSLIVKDYITKLELLGAMSHVNYEEFCAIGERLRGKLRVQILAQGNLFRNSVISMVDSIQSSLGWMIMEDEHRPKTLCYKLKRGEKYCQVLSFNENNVNSDVTNYYQGEEHNMKDNCIIKLLMLLMEEPLFDTLRTKEQLGYNLYCTYLHTGSILGFSITVQGQTDKHSVEHIDERIENFLKTFYEEVKTMNQCTFDMSREALIKLNKCVDVDLKEEFTRNWGEIINKDYCFDRLKQEICILKTVTKDDVLDWLRDHTRCGESEKYRKLSIQVVGYEGDRQHLNKISEFKYNFVHSGENEKFIHSFEEFRKDLPLSGEQRVVLPNVQFERNV